jgi:hypothetical protein
MRTAGAPTSRSYRGTSRSPSKPEPARTGRRCTDAARDAAATAELRGLAAGKGVTANDDTLRLARRLVGHALGARRAQEELNIEEDAVVAVVAKAALGLHHFDANQTKSGLVVVHWISPTGQVISTSSVDKAWWRGTLQIEQAA